MKHLYKNDDVYACSLTCNNIGDALNFVKQEWPSPDVEISIKGNKITVVYDGEYEDRPITLAKYELR